MKYACLAALLLALPALAEEAPKPLTGTYEMGSKTILDPPPSEKIDTVRFHITGKTAADMWKAMPAKPKFDECIGMDMKTANNLVCQENRPGDYMCFVGINLRTGAAVGAVVC
ncbi:hypothetical protein ACFSM5_04335 [Lacibacterium aquatile]|uniref:DUF3617 family protein n=1 Tax=Lacibacterium aquatile TaxID=1168082 RepID=A0ABW5DLU0_9PROT